MHSDRTIPHSGVDIQPGFVVEDNYPVAPVAPVAPVVPVVPVVPVAPVAPVAHTAVHRHLGLNRLTGD